LESTVAELLASGKGILAADESFSTIGKRFADFDLPNTEETRRAYRELLLTTPSLCDFISGVILFDETIRQRTPAGILFVEHLTRHGIIPGIKVDMGTALLPGFPGEKFTLGLDGLQERLEEYRQLGARFTKWRAVFTVGEGLPHRTSLESNATALALFAGLSQEAGLVPIVEPEVLMDGNHTVDRCEDVTTEVLRSVFCALTDHRVSLEHLILKSGMVLSGKDSPEQADDEAIAAATLRCFRRTVPLAVPGIVFLSGGQNDEEASLRLNTICSRNTNPWKLSFSFGRALQSSALGAWRGLPENCSIAQGQLSLRSKCNSSAVQGRYFGPADRVFAEPSITY
jgi:fructose-bisphosphate aldolase class I